MSTVTLITEAIYAELLTLLPDSKRAPFVWAEGKNSTKDKLVYMVRPGRGLNVEGTNRAVTVDQDFEVILMRRWPPQSGTKDTELDAAILGLFEDAEVVWRKLFQRKLNADPAKVLVVSVVDFGAPEIDNENNTAQLSVSFTVKYRTETT